jgi:hypothetical protein
VAEQQLLFLQRLLQPLEEMADQAAAEVVLQEGLGALETRLQLLHRKVITAALDTPEANPLTVVAAAGQVLLVKAILNMLLAAMELLLLFLVRP